MKSQLSTNLILQLIQANPESVKSNAPIYRKNQGRNSYSNFSQSIENDKSAPDLTEINQEITAHSSSSSEHNPDGSIINSFRKFNFHDHQSYEFSPFSLSTERGWNELHALFKKMSIKKIGENLKVILIMFSI
jgi:hypothetical protein